MSRIRSLAVAAATLAVTALVGVPAAQAAPGQAPGQQQAGHYSFAVIGDVPYGAAQVARFPGWVDDINAADPSLVLHVGDIKSGSDRCDTSYYKMIRTQFDRFEAPLVYTPGDNEWTDCHRPNNGSYNPYERLDTIRRIFFDKPGTTLGEPPTKVSSQAALGFPENVSLRRQGISMAAIHVVGSNNGLAPWTGATAPNQVQVTEERARMDASIDLVRQTFANAGRRHDRAVAIFLQADMFDPDNPRDGFWDTSAFNELVQVLTDESSAFNGDVYLFDGDSHTYNVDKPLAAGSAWLGYYGVRGTADNLTRITVDGSSNNKDWLRVTVNRPGAAEALSWQRVAYTH
ncbi:Calcineurin-like phosphoesterase [Raineyella antarctica]|uniref:Calcineurin-like phosphoesterase n=1 Tax=Raineyella antarctica TaxID=1577474 RepID=A0A1G6HH70_9ACTN|nr:metallophosphoesterase family protein [Raineyella antarctica]SDB93493.1 Calcineurin-like phosphoesterase [Raineyella antarctica]